MEFMYLVFTRIPGESYRRRLRSLLLYLCYVFRALINPLCADIALKVSFTYFQGDYSTASIFGLSGSFNFVFLQPPSCKMTSPLPAKG